MKEGKLCREEKYNTMNKRKAKQFAASTTLERSNEHNKYSKMYDKKKE